MFAFNINCVRHENIDVSTRVSVWVRSLSIIYLLSNVWTPSLDRQRKQTGGKYSNFGFKVDNLTSSGCRQQIYFQAMNPMFIGNKKKQILRLLFTNYPIYSLKIPIYMNESGVLNVTMLIAAPKIDQK